MSDDTEDKQQTLVQDDQGIELLGHLVRERDIFDFWIDRIGSFRCQVCAKDDYLLALYSPHANRVTVITSAEVGEDSDGERSVSLNVDLFMPVFYCWCQSCGHVRHHLVARVIEYLRERETKEGGNA